MIQKEICSYYGLEMSELLSKSVINKWFFPARSLCISVVNDDASYPQIGDQFGGRDHTTVIHAAEKVEKDIQGDSELAATVALYATIIIQILSMRGTSY
jgi:chromosomal replication initiator protein